MFHVSGSPIEFVLDDGQSARNASSSPVRCLILTWEVYIANIKVHCLRDRSGRLHVYIVENLISIFSGWVGCDNTPGGRASIVPPVLAFPFAVPQAAGERFVRR